MQIFAPLSVATNLKITKKIASAVNLPEMPKNEDWSFNGYKQAFPYSKIELAKSSYDDTSGNLSLTLAVTMDTGIPDGDVSAYRWKRLACAYSAPSGELSADGEDCESFSESAILLIIKNKSDGTEGYIFLTKDILAGYMDKRLLSKNAEKQIPPRITKDIEITNLTKINPIQVGVTRGLSKITPSTDYSASLYYAIDESAIKALDEKGDTPVSDISILTPYRKNNLTGTFGTVYLKIAENSSITTAGIDQSIIINDDVTKEGEGTSAGGDGLPDCGLKSLFGCFAQFFYYVFFKPTSFLFAVSGKLLDVTLMYSVSDASYRSAFISEAWKTVRDICNMFFIFVLLYVAFQMMLNMADSKTKSLVAHVVLVGIIMNFSLFFAQVVIDASNIMARVFYNPKVMSISKAGDASGSKSGEYGEIMISEFIVSGFNPTKIIMNAKDTASIGDTTADYTNKNNNGVSSGTFILISILSSVINVIGMLSFLSISMFLIGRVVSLWMIMILSPIAILSYALPDKIQSSMKDFGAKEWWGKLISVSFMAPVLVFFLYIILLFVKKGLGIWTVTNGSVSGVNYIISVILPFLIVMFLIREAKNRAKGMSDEIGKVVASQVGNIAGFLGGGALGVATGGAAFAARGTIGKLGNKIANSEYLKNKAANGNGFTRFMANKTMGAGKAIDKSSFDFRNTKASTYLGKEFKSESGISLGGGNILNSKKGYSESKKDEVNKIINRTENFRMSENEAAQQNKQAKKWKEDRDKKVYEQMEIDRQAALAANRQWGAAEEAASKKRHTEDFERTNKKVQTADEIYRERVKNYRDKHQNKRPWQSKTVHEAADNKLQDLSKDPDAPKPITAKENYEANKTADVAQKAIQNSKDLIQKIENETNEELNKIEVELTNVADELRTHGIANVDHRGVDKTHITALVDKRNEILRNTLGVCDDKKDKVDDLSSTRRDLEKEIRALEQIRNSGGTLSADQITKLTNTQNLRDQATRDLATARNEYQQALANKKKEEDEIIKLKTLMERKDGVEKRKIRDEESITRQRDRITRNQNIVDEKTEITNKYRP